MQDDVVTSPSNPLVKRLVRLRERRVRERAGVAPVEGARELARAAAAGVPIRLLVTCPELHSEEAARAATGLAQAAAETRRFARPAFERASMRQGPDGILGLVVPPRRSLDDLPLEGGSRYLVLAGLEKPGNVGALLRTAVAAGVDAVLLTGAGADAWNPNVVRASMGAVFAVPVVEASDADARAALRAAGVRTVATSPAAGVRHWDADLAGRVAVVVGTEHEGLDPAWLEVADQLVSIPMAGAVDSLNAATAGALVLFEALRQATLRSADAGPRAPT